MYRCNKNNSNSSTTGRNGGDASRVEKSTVVRELINLRCHSQDHPAQSTLKPCWEKERRETKSFGWTANQRAVQFRIDPLNVVPTLPMPIIPPWILPDATVDVSLLENKNRNIAIPNPT